VRLFIALPVLALAACGHQEVPIADPAEMEQLLVRLEAEQASAADLLPAKASAKIHQAERLVPPLEKVQVDKIDPQIALSVISG
jgi:hypothetical protein